MFRSEVEFLEQAVAKEREKYQMSTQVMSSGLSAIPVMAINDSVSIAKRLMQTNVELCHLFLHLIIDFSIC